MQLGVILSPYGAHSPYGWGTEIAQARGGKGVYLPQPAGYPHVDRQHNTRGEVGFYYDSRLGEYQPRTKIGAAVKGWWDRTFKRPTPEMVPTSAATPVALPQGDGMTPTDVELSKNVVCYTPLHSGWINAKEGFVPGAWRFNWNPAGKYGPKTSLSGLGGFGAEASAATASDVLDAMNAHNRRMFQLAIVSTAAVSISALISLGLRYRRLKHEMARKSR